MSRKSIFFTATHRSGSTVLLDSIRLLDSLGRPGELFYPRNILGILQRHGLKQELEADTWIPALIAEGSSPNGIFSTKLFADNLHWLVKELSGGSWPEGLNSLAEFFETHFPNALFVSIRRRDKLRQGISLLKAMQSGLWHSTQETKVIARQPYYDRQQIMWAISNIESQEKDLDLLFDSLGASPQIYYYEDLIDDLEGTVRTIFEAAGEQMPNCGIPDSGLARMSNRQTEAWVERFQREEKDSQGAGQSILENPASPVFDIKLEPPSSLLLPGTQTELTYRIRNTREEAIRFIGRKGGWGSINLLLKCTAPDGTVTDYGHLPVPYQLEPGEQREMAFHSPLPRQAGPYGLEITAEQKGSTKLCLTGKTAVNLDVAGHLDKPLQTLFGDYEFTGDSWYFVPWFGYFSIYSWPWILSLDHGWLKLKNPSFDGDSMSLEVSDSELGEWTTCRINYPELRTGEGGIVRFCKTEDDTRLFRDAEGNELTVPLSTRHPEA